MFGFAVGARGIGPGKAVFDMLPMQDHVEGAVLVAGALVGEHAADGEAEARIVGAAIRKKRMAELWVWSGRMAAKLMREESSMAMRR